MLGYSCCLSPQIETVTKSLIFFRKKIGEYAMKYWLSALNQFLRVILWLVKRFCSSPLMILPADRGDSLGNLGR
jgi:hypothetical protein